MAILKATVKLDTSGLARLASPAKQRAITLKAVKAGAKVIPGAAKSLAPRRSGALKQSLGIKAVRGTKGKTSALAVIGARKKVVKEIQRSKKSASKTKAVPAFYAHLVEKGTRPHALGKGAKLARKGKPQIHTNQTGRQHPGAKAHPFLKPAWEGNADRAIEAGEKVISQEIAKLMTKSQKT